MVFWFSDTSLGLGPPFLSEPGRPGAGPAPAARGPGLSPRFSSVNVRNPAVSGPTVHSAEIEYSPFRKCYRLRSPGGDGGSHGEYRMSPGHALRAAGFLA